MPFMGIFYCLSIFTAYITHMEKALVSSCLLGQPCRWDGEKINTDLSDRFKDIEIFSICPEMDAGMPSPRSRAEIDAGDGSAVLDGASSVTDSEGHNVTATFLRGAQHALNLSLTNNITKAILKDKSPSCGVNRIYVKGKLVKGMGVTAALLYRHKLEIHSII